MSWIFRWTAGPFGPAACLALALAACGPEEAPRAVEAPAEEPTHPDSAMTRRHAEELDAAVTGMREHVRSVRQASPDQWHARVGEHAPRVARMLGTVERQMLELDMGIGMSDEEMGEMMGMGAEDYRATMEEIKALRSEVEQLQTAPEPAVRQRMPEHLERVERILGVMERTAAHMRGG